MLKKDQFAKQEHILQSGPWELKTVGVYLWLECISCDWTFGVLGLPFPPEPQPIQSKTAKVICRACYMKMLKDDAPEWLKEASNALENPKPKGNTSPATQSSQKRKGVEM